MLDNMAFVKSLLTMCLGAVCCMFMSLFLVLSIPVYVFRQVVIVLAKYFRPDLGDIISGLSAIYVADYMTETPPRSVAVKVLVFEGHLTLEELKRRILKNWIEENEKFENFQRYPKRWLGFTFWKDASYTFSIDEHVKMYSRNETQVTDEQLIKLVEKLLNTKLPKFQSPWEMYLIENFKYSSEGLESLAKSKTHSALVFRWHHSLMDGYGVMTAVVDGLFEQRWIRQPEGPRPKASLYQKLFYILTFPLKVFTETAHFYSHVFTKDPFKVPDEKKDWYQLVLKSTPIPVKVIKDIKNTFGVGYASVIISAMSTAIYRTLKNASPPLKNKSTLCLSVLPSIGVTKRKVLDNHMSAAVFELPTVSFENSIERLKKVNQIMENTRGSVVPILTQYYSTLMGAHTYLVNGFLTKNRMIPIGITNFAFPLKDIEINQHIKWIDTWGFGGGHSGQAGLGVMAISHGRNSYFIICAERAVMSEKQAEEFMSYLKDEIGHLQALAL